MDSRLKIYTMQDNCFESIVAKEVKQLIVSVLSQSN